ncbi:MAG: alkaline ceramidase, partial [Bacteroidetes bacterium]
MNYLTRVLNSALLLVALCLLPGCVRQAQENAPRFQVGAASAVVNPPVGAFIAGDKQNRRFTGVHDSLYVKAVVMYDGQSSLAILTVDCIGLMYPEVLRIRERVSAICDFPAERIILSSTHTHSGPDVVGLWGADYAHSGVDTAYQTFLIHTAARQIELADKAKREATVHVGETVFGEPWVQNICQEEIDRSLTMMQFTDAEGKSIASLTNFACHPTFLDAVFSEVSSDYLSTFYQTVNAGWGGTNLFLQGPI